MSKKGLGERRGAPACDAVVGGSIGGLCAGLALHRAELDVHIYEKSGVLTSRGAGIVVQPELRRLIAIGGGAPLVTTGCTYRRYLEPHGDDGARQHAPQTFTSWQSIYQALRSMFPDDRYHHSRTVEAIHALNGVDPAIGGTRLSVDLVVGADGASSALRRKHEPERAL